MGEYIDDFEKMEEDNEKELVRSCFNCKHNKVAINKEPCASCRNRRKWEKRKDGAEE
jgi:ribosomal protein S8